MKIVTALWVLLRGSLGVFGQVEIPNDPEHIGLNFMRPDANRPGNYDFVNHGRWLVGEFKKLGVKWNRVAFSRVVIQSEEERYDWSAFDRVVEACEKNGIQILATLGGHFDRPPVPAWAGSTLAEVVEKNPAALEGFIRAWVRRYRGRIHSFERLNEPKVHHQGLTVFQKTITAAPDDETRQNAQAALRKINRANPAPGK
jgi:beta-glucosidase/6-phospho-beta-glucosidase/beta-galactosidase